jgi:hypothetical protein
MACLLAASIPASSSMPRRLALLSEQPGRACLQAHHADVVGGDVVQFGRDPGSFLGGDGAVMFRSFHRLDPAARAHKVRQRPGHDDSDGRYGGVRPAVSPLNVRGRAVEQPLQVQQPQRRQHQRRYRASEGVAAAHPARADHRIQRDHRRRQHQQRCLNRAGGEQKAQLSGGHEQEQGAAGGDHPGSPRLLPPDGKRQRHRGTGEGRGGRPLPARRQRPPACGDAIAENREFERGEQGGSQQSVPARPGDQPRYRAAQVARGSVHGHRLRGADPPRHRSRE